MSLKLSGKNEIWFTFGITILVFLFLFAYVFDGKIDLNGDNASYYILGKALNTGEGFVNLNNIHKTPNNHFPPGYPFIIALVMIFSHSFVIIKLVNGFFLLGSIFLSYLLVRKFSQNNVVAWITIAFLLTNSHLLRYGTIMMSELAFLFFTLLSLSFFLKTYEKQYVNEIRYYILAFLCLTVSFYIRTQGIALLAAFLFMMLKDYRTKWKYMLSYSTGFLLTFLPWLARSNNLGGNSYLKQLLMANPYQPESGVIGIEDFSERIIKNIERYITREIPDVIFPFKTVLYREDINYWEWISGILLIGIIILGIWKLPKYRWLAIIYFISTFSILLIWPDVWVGVRFVLPLTPLLVMAMLLGFKWLLQQLSVFLNLKKPVPLWPIALILLLNVTEVQKLRKKAQANYESNWNNYFNIAMKFQREGVKDIVVSCRKPSLFYLFSETYTTNYKYTSDYLDLISDLEERETDFVILDQLGYGSTYRYLYPAIQNSPDNFEIIARLENPETFLLKFVPHTSD